MQALSQQIPSVQKPEAQVSAALQAAPLARAVAQVPPLQDAPAAQSVSPTQESRHLSGPHTKGPQLRCVPGTQTPAPLQVDAPVSVPAVQVRGPQGVAAAKSWQAPAPSHLPVRPQLSWASGLHPSLRGSELATRFWHEPSAPGMLQDRQGPVQEATSQHTPSTQAPELQSGAAAQGAPSGFLPHEPARQGVPGTQSASLSHRSLHVPSAQV